MISNEVFCDQAGVNIAQAAPSRVLVTTRRKLYLILLYCFLTPTMGVCALLITAVFVMAFSDPLKDDVSGMLCVGSILLPMMLLIIGAWLLSIVGLYLAVYQRRFLIDIDRATCVFQGAPGLSCEFAFDQIESVSLCSGYGNGWHLCWLCLSIRGHKRFFHIQNIARRKGPRESLIDELRPAADILSRLIDCPVQTHDNVTAMQMSWR
ncbi:MAG TPA: hypothetical protein VMM76_05755 [Pirellulaceae bacterium]|nr:hypothetical protein [Pirellulaceae bacterium]